MGKIIVSVVMDKDLWEKAKECSKKVGMGSISSFVRYALVKVIKEIEKEI